MQQEFKKYLISNAIVSTATMIKVFTLKNFNVHNFEITPEQFVLLDATYQNKGLYQRQIGILLGKDRANVTRLIHILEKKELIIIKEDSNGRRVKRIEITQKGKELRDKIFIEIKKIRNVYLKNIDDDELLNCIKTLDKIKNNIPQDIKLAT